MLINMKIGIIGNGVVGQATSLLACPEIKLSIYDTDPERCQPPHTTLRDICACDLIFISVPTPMNPDGSCHLDILETVIGDLKKIQSLESLYIVNRSTVPVGTSDRLGCHSMPEFLTERNGIHDFTHNPDWIFGLSGTSRDQKFKMQIIKLIETCHQYGCIKSKKIHFVKNREAEMVKLFRNNFLATKVSFCNEIYQFCQSINLDYENVRTLAVRDPRIGASHTQVPGPDGNLGYGGTCFPKDSSSLLHQIQETGKTSYIVQATVTRNAQVDRPSK